MNEARLNQLDEVFMSCAENISSMSLATRAKVGALIVKDGNIISMGWNGMPSGFPNEDIEIKHEDGSLTTNPLVLHAESNAILKCAKNDSSSSNGAALYVTMSPCVECTKLIIQAGIKKVLYRTQYRNTDSLDVLQLAGVEVVHLKGDY